MGDKVKLPYGKKLGYGVGALSYGIPFQLVSGFFVFYTTAILGLSGTLVGMLVSISIVWDAVTDPVMGYISDKTNTNIFLGRRLFYVMTGAVGLALCNYLLWSIDSGLSGAEKTALIGVLIILLKTFSTVVTTPYLALGAELTSDYSERNSVQSFRTAFFFLGYLFPAVIGMTLFFGATPEFESGQLNPGAYPALGLCASLIVLLSAAVCIIMTYSKNRAAAPPKQIKSGIAGMLRETVQALKCSDFRNVSLGLLFINTAMGIVGSVGMHVFTFTFGFTSRQIAIVFGSLFLMALVAQPFWNAIANRFEKRTALVACLYINIAVSALFVLLVIMNDWVSQHYLAALPAALLMGLSMGGSISLPYSMISDTIDKNAYYSGTRKEGVFYGCATFMYKLSQALAVMLTGILLDAIEFDAEAVQAPHIYLKLGFILPAGFLVCFAAALLFVRKYTLDRQAVAVFQQNADKGPSA